MATDTNQDGYSFVRTFSNVSGASAKSKTTARFSSKSKLGRKQCKSLSYKLAVNVTLEKYEKRSDEFNIPGCWEWVIGIACRNVDDTPAEIYVFGSTIEFPNRIDKGTRPWPNMIIEVAYSETIDHVTDKVKNYWLKPDRVHDAIVVKTEPVLEDQIPTHMIIEEQDLPVLPGPR
ncbi:12987_t:CDS:2, partial [Acaulospora morrowiae]